MQLVMKVSVLIVQELQEFQESLGRNNATHVSVILMEMLSVQRYFVTMMMMLWKFVLTVRVNLEFLENHGKKTATLVGWLILYNYFDHKSMIHIIYRCASTGVALCSQRFCVNIQPRGKK